MFDFTRTMLGILCMAACGSAGLVHGAWNNPYPAADAMSNTLYLPFEERPKHLDPARSYSEQEAVITQQIYEPPLQYHFLHRPYRLVPLTVTQVPVPRYFNDRQQPLPDDAPTDTIAYSVYRLELRPGIRYQPHPAFAVQDGRHLYLDLSDAALDAAGGLDDFGVRATREVTAADYVYQIKRLANPQLQSPVLGFMSKYIIGLAELGEQLATAHQLQQQQNAWLDLRMHNLSGVRQLDKYTFEIKIKGKYLQFVYWLTMPFFAPMAWEVEKFYAQHGMAGRNLTLDWYPVGSGPYQLVENNPNRRMVLERNPNFRVELFPNDGEVEDGIGGMLVDAGNRMPFIDKVVYSLEQEAIPAWTKFLQGYYDISGINSDGFDQAVRVGSGGQAMLTPAMEAKGMKLLEAVRPSNYYFGFNMRDPMVGGESERARLLRLAVSIAVDYEEYISIFANGRGLAAHGALPPGIFGYRDGRDGLNPYVYDWVNGKAQRKSIDEARQLLKAAGHDAGADGSSTNALVLNYDTALTGPDAKARLDWLRKQFDKLGIQLVIRATDYNRFQDKVRNGSVQMFEWGWNADYPDPENFLFLLYGANGKVTHAGENAANYANPVFDSLFETMINLPDGPSRQSIIDQMQELLRHDAPWAWGWFPVSYTLHHAWYGNAKPNLMARNALKYRRLDPVARERAREQWNQPVLWPLAFTVLLILALVLLLLFTYRRREHATAL